MTKKTFPDLCLERAEKATEGPWNKDINGYVEDVVRHTVAQCFSTPSLDGRSLYRRKIDNSEFIAASRQMVPELAKRLKIACETLRCIGAEHIADELETIPEEK